MNFRHHVAILISLAVLLILSCGDGSGSGHPSGHVSTPAQHRATTPAACSGQSPGAECLGGGECTHASDCTGGLDGYCGGAASCTCTYGDCVTDADCAAGTDCDCNPIGGGSFWSGPSKCLPSNCRTDADCGLDGFCSLSQNPAASEGCGGPPRGWYCHTAHDECGVDFDCVSDSSTTPHPLCLFAPERGIWACSSGVRCSG